jgi:hypothetical protein
MKELAGKLKAAISLQRNLRSKEFELELTTVLVGSRELGGGIANISSKFFSKRHPWRSAFTGSSVTGLSTIVV